MTGEITLAARIHRPESEYIIVEQRRISQEIAKEEFNLQSLQCGNKLFTQIPASMSLKFDISKLGV